MLFVWPDRFWRYWLLGLILFCFAVVRYQLALPVYEPDKIYYYNGQKVEFSGIVLSEPDYRIDHLKLTVWTRELFLNGQPKKVSGKVLVKTNLYPQYQYGDELKISGRLVAPEPVEEFQYDRYLAKEDIYAATYYSKISRLSGGRGNILVARIYAQKGAWQALIDQNLPEPQSSLFSAMILGARRGIPSGLSDQFNLTGTTHLVAISGFNISIIVTILVELAMVFYLPRKKAFWVVSLVLVCYIIIIGFPASAVRAAIMGWLVILARQVGRQSKLTQAILLAAAVMLLFNPKILRDDAGFQLSFLALLGLAYLSPVFENLLSRFPEKFGWRESLQTTLAAQASTMPLIAFSFGRISLIAPVVNLLVVPAAVWLTIFGTATVLIVQFLPFLQPMFFWPNYLLLTYIIKLVKFFSGLPNAGLNL